MRLLALDTSAAHCAAAVFEGEALTASETQAMARGQAEHLVPQAEAVLGRAGVGWHDLDALAVGIGPGNFTGIRIAVSAVRGLSLALGIPAIGVSTFEAMAFGRSGPVLVCLDARRERFYLQGFGAAALEPMLWDPDAASRLDLPAGTRVVGSKATHVAAMLGLDTAEPADHPDIEAFGRAARDLGPGGAPPAPLYLRRADAAPSSDPPPVILDGR